LFVQGQMPKALPLAQEVMCLIKCGAIDSFSIGYSATDTEQKSDGTRALKEVSLWEVSMVTLPMNPQAKLVSAKTAINITELKEQIKTKRDLEHFLRESGLVSKEGATWLSSCFDLPKGDPSAEEKADEVERLMSEFMANLKKPL
jgi:Caudovirus prohead serine protease